MRVAIALAGTDRGRSGLGTYIHALVPRLALRLAASGGELVALGTRADLDAYAACLANVRASVLPSFCDGAAASAAFHLALVGGVARRAGASVLLLPAANRRATFDLGLPTVAVVHDLAQLHVREKYDRVRMAYLRALVRGPLRRATALVAVSRATRDDLALALGRAPATIRIVPNGVDVARFRPDATDRHAAELAANGFSRPYVLYVSRLENPGKNHLRLLRAFARSTATRGHELVFAGPDWGAHALIAAEIATLGVGDRVRVLGRVSDDLLRALTSGADAVAMVGLREGFGLPVLEALACGKPVLVARAGALPEVAGELGVLCDPLDEISMAAGLSRVLSDAAYRARVRAEGPAWAAKHDWNHTASALLDVCAAARAA